MPPSVSSLIATAIFSLAIHGSAWAESGKDPWSMALEAQSLIDTDKVSDAVPIQRLAAKIGAEGALWSDLIGLRIKLASRSKSNERVLAVESERFAKAFAAIGDKATADLCIAWADTLRRSGKFDQATAILDRVGASFAGVTRARAAEVAAMIQMDQGRPIEALAAVDVGLGNVRAPSPADGSSSSDAGAEERERLHQARARIVDMQDIVLHGLGFRLYRDANALRLQRNHEAALKAWDDLIAAGERNAGRPVIMPASPDDPRIKDTRITPVYLAAARFYRAVALFGLTKWDDAEQAAEAVLAEPDQPWQVDAEILLGDIAYEGDINIKGALGHYENAARRARDTAQMEKGKAAYPIPEVSRQRTAPSGDLVTTDKFGVSQVWAADRPDMVVNAQSTPFYPKRLMLDAFLGEIACRVALNDSDAAQEALELYAAIDPESQGREDSGMPTSVKRLRDGLRLGHFGARTEEMALFIGQYRARLIKAEILAEVARFNDAWACYDRLVQDRRFKPDLKQQAYLDYARGICATYLENESQVKGFMAGFDGPSAKYRKTYTYWRAQFLIADRWPNRSNELLQRGAAECEDRNMALFFMMTLGQKAYGNGDDATAARWFAQVVARGLADDYRVRAAKQALDLIASHTKKP